MLGQFVTDNHYGVANLELLQDPSGNEMWRLRVVINVPATKPIVNCISGLMVTLATLCNVEYEGWGGVIQSETATPPPLPR